jgi:flagellar biosynthetic protein FliR
VRVALAALTAFLIAPGLPAFDAAGLGLWPLVGVMMQEVINGLVIGFVTRMVFFCIDVAGQIIATEVGLNLAADVNPLSGVRTEVPGLILFYLGAMLFLALDMHHYLIAAVERGYAVLPVGAGVLGAAVVNDVIGHTSRIFAVAVQIAAPMMAVSFIVMLVFSLIGRAVQQISSFFESFAFRLLAGLFMMGLSLNLMAQHLAAYLHRLPEDMMRITELLAG